jgi:hypothetical protein
MFEELLAVAVVDYLNAAVVRREIGDERAAAENGMCGSPTLLVNGVDPFAVPGQVPSLSCRLYRDETGRHVLVPSLVVLRQALAAADG